VIGWNRSNDGRDLNDTEAKVHTEVVRAALDSHRSSDDREPDW
jgi:hypothetical protein